MKFILCPASWKKTRLNRICLSMATSNCNHCEMDAQSTHNDCCQRHSFNCRPETAVWTKRMGIPSSHFSNRKNKTKEGRNLRAYTLMQIPNKNVLSNLNVYYINTKYYVALKVKGVQVVLLYIEKCTSETRKYIDDIDTFAYIKALRFMHKEVSYSGPDHPLFSSKLEKSLFDNESHFVIYNTPKRKKGRIATHTHIRKWIKRE